MNDHTVIWKYPIPLRNTSRIAMPAGATVLDIQRQDDALAMWVRVDATHPPEERTFHIFGTGTYIPNDECYVYLASVQYDGFVWHIFEQLAYPTPSV